MSDFLISDLRAERDRALRLSTELDGLRLRVQADPDHAGLRQRLADIEGAHRSSQDRVDQLEHNLGRIDHLRDVGSRSMNRERGADFGPDHAVGPDERRGAAFAESQSVIEEDLRSGELTTSAADRLDNHLRNQDPVGADAQIVAAAGQPEYREAFGKWLMFGTDALLRMTDQERDAFSQVNLAQNNRAMAESLGSAGGFGLPISIDPSITNLSNGAINPLRQLATVRTMSTHELRLVASDGVVASYSPEAVEVTDTSPTLSQPILFAERATAFVPYSIEVGMDWGSLQQQMVEHISDAKDVLEANKFLLGGGHAASEPAGLLGGVAGSLGSAQQVTTAGVASVSTTDVYSLKQSIPPRFIATMQYLVSPAMLDTFYRLVVRASTTDPTLVSDDRKSILGKPLNELSTMSTTLATGQNIAIAGDFTKFIIADRVGMTAEIVPHLFGTNRRPSGQRGIFCYWRNTSAVITSAAPNASLRYLTTR